MPVQHFRYSSWIFDKVSNRETSRRRGVLFLRRRSYLRWRQHCCDTISSCRRKHGVIASDELERSTLTTVKVRRPSHDLRIMACQSHVAGRVHEELKRERFGYRSWTPSEVFEDLKDLAASGSNSTCNNKIC